jgi:hypothetical protein
MVNATSGLYHKLNPGLAHPTKARVLASGGSLNPIGAEVSHIPSAQLYARFIESVFNVCVLVPTS